jgi:hypothetical protein
MKKDILIICMRYYGKERIINYKKEYTIIKK